jgi:hypothetical protein
VLSFHILIAVLAGATTTVALQRPNYFALPVFFLLLLALFSGLLVASFHAFSDIEILRRRVFGLRRHVSDLLSLNGSAGPDDPGERGTSLFRECSRQLSSASISTSGRTTGRPGNYPKKLSALSLEWLVRG